MKSIIYFVEFADGSIRLNKDKKNILDDIYDYVKHTEYDAIGEYQLDSIIYNRTKTLPRYINKIGVCPMDKLMDNIKLDTNKKYSDRYTKSLLNKKYNERLDYLKIHKSQIDFSKFKTIINTKFNMD
jgi:hypothetical protein